MNTLNLPKIQVDVRTFLEMARTYKELPQDASLMEIWLEIDKLERIAYRKYKQFVTISKKEKK